MSRDGTPDRRCGGSSDGALREVIAAVTCWLAGDRVRGNTFAAVEVSW